MGTWGTGIFQNDVADNVKTVYVSKLKIGKSDEEAVEELIAENTELLSDNEDTLDFWLALSSVMYDHGRLNEKVKSKAGVICQLPPCSIINSKLRMWASTLVVRILNTVRLKVSSLSS